MKEMCRLLLLLLTGTGLARSQFLPTFPRVYTTDETICPCQGHPLTGPPTLFDRRTPDDVQFHLYTRSNKESPESINIGKKKAFLSSSFDGSRQVKFITHGYTEGIHYDQYMIAMKDAILSKDDVNVILVYWGRLAGSENYVVSARNALFVGRIIANLLYFIQDNTQQFSGDQVHLIGFSMGAQASGAAGYHYPGISRITGLDPAGPSFECVDDKDRLDPSDAGFVDIVHTNGGCLSAGYIGNRHVSGHLDFYVNGGSHQPGCDNLYIDVARAVLSNHKVDICSHDRAHHFFIESIKASEPVYGFSCESFDEFKSGACFKNPKVEFGYSATKQSFNGTFYFQTHAESPYLGRQIRIEVDVSEQSPAIFPGGLNIQALLPERQNLITSVSSGSTVQTLRAGRRYKASLAVPLGKPLNEVTFALAPSGSLVPSLPFSSFVAKTIKAKDMTTGSKYCFGSNVVLSVSQVVNVTPTKGAC